MYSKCKDDPCYGRCCEMWELNSGERIETSPIPVILVGDEYTIQRLGVSFSGSLVKPSEDFAAFS